MLQEERGQVPGQVDFTVGKARPRVNIRRAGFHVLALNAGARQAGAERECAQGKPGTEYSFPAA